MSKPAAPTVIYGSANSLWHEGPDGSLLVDVDGTICNFRRDRTTGRFHFLHDDLADCEEAGTVRNVVIDGKGIYQAFRTGQIWWTVAYHDPVNDVYWCEPRKAPVN